MLFPYLPVAILSVAVAATAPSSGEGNLSSIDSPKSPGRISAVPAEKSPEEADIPILPAKEAVRIRAWLDPVLSPYLNGDYEKAIQEYKGLLETAPDGPEKEALLFLKGDIYFKLGESGDSDFLQAALTAYHEANLLYPNSPNTPRVLLKTGEVSSLLGLHYESIASYKRIIAKYPESRFVPKAYLGIARTYQLWGRWKEAREAYSRISTAGLAPEDRPLAILGLAETLYNSGDYSHAYLIFAGGMKSYESAFSREPLTFYHFADAAIETGRAKEAKEILLKFYNIFPRDTLTLTVLSRLIDIFYLEENGNEASNLNDVIQNLFPGPVGEKITGLIGEIEEIKTSECMKSSRKGGVRLFIIEKCGAGFPKQLKALRDAMREIGSLTDGLLQEPPPSEMIQQFVYQEGEQFRRAGNPSIAFELDKRLFPFLDETPFQRDVLVARNRAAVEAVNRDFQEGREISVVELYFGSPDIFNGKLLFGQTGFKIASSLIHAGFYSQAIPILESSFISSSQIPSDEAGYLYSAALAEAGDPSAARKSMELFLKRFPGSAHRPEITERLGDFYFKSQHFDLAISQYGNWLSHNPDGAGFRKISLKLGSAYEKSGQLREAVPVYARLIEREPHAGTFVYQKLGDAYFQLRDFQKAIQAYQSGLREGGDRASADWFRYRLATCYEAMGESKKENAIYGELAKSSGDPLIRTLAFEKTSAPGGTRR